MDVKQYIEQLNEKIKQGKKVIMSGKTVKKFELRPSERSMLVVIHFDDESERIMYVSDFLRRKVNIV